MKIQDKLCYSKLLWLFMNKDFTSSVSKTVFTKPAFEHEGMAGYIETDVEFEVISIQGFAKAYEAYTNVPSKVKTDFYYDILRMRGMCT